MCKLYDIWIIFFVGACEKLKKRMRKIILFGFLAIINIAQAQTDPKKYGMEKDNLPMGLKIGDKIENFTSTNQNGEPFDLYIALENGPVVLNTWTVWMIRSVWW